jgi:hypothetical protein
LALTAEQPATTVLLVYQSTWFNEGLAQASQLAHQMKSLKNCKRRGLDGYKMVCRLRVAGTVRSKKGDYMMDDKKEVWTCQYLTVSSFVAHLAYHRGLWAVRNRIKNHKAFWATTIQSHLELALINWCKVFGSERQDIHWTKTTTGNTEDLRNRMLSKTGFTENERKGYQTKIRDFRDKFVAYLDMDGVMHGGLPDFDPALQVAYAYEEWAKAIESALREYASFRLRYEEWKAKAFSVVSQLPRP